MNIEALDIPQDVKTLRSIIGDLYKHRNEPAVRNELAELWQALGALRDLVEEIRIEHFEAA